EILVTHREHFVDQNDVGVDVDGDGKTEASLHPGGVEYHRRVNEILKLRKLHDLGDNLFDLLLTQSEPATVEAAIVGSGQITAQSRPELDEGGDLSIDLHFPFVGIDDAAQDFDQRAFSRAVIAHDGKGFTLLDGEGDVFQGGEFGVPLFPLGQGD